MRPEIIIRWLAGTWTVSIVDWPKYEQNSYQISEQFLAILFGWADPIEL